MARLPVYSEGLWDGTVCCLESISAAGQVADEPACAGGGLFCHVDGHHGAELSLADLTLYCRPLQRLGADGDVAGSRLGVDVIGRSWRASVDAGAAGAGRRLACEQLSGVHQKRGPDAAGATSAAELDKLGGEISRLGKKSGGSPARGVGKSSVAKKSEGGNAKATKPKTAADEVLSRIKGLK